MSLYDPCWYLLRQQSRMQDKHGNLYKVKAYHYDKLSKLERAKRKEQKESKRFQELSNIELSKIVNHMFHSQTS
jgi:hypothetical protein